MSAPATLEAERSSVRPVRTDTAIDASTRVPRAAPVLAAPVRPTSTHVVAERRVVARPDPARRARAAGGAQTRVAADPRAGGWRRSAGLLAVVTVLIGVANYALSLVATHLLPAGEFSDYAGAQGLLLVLGTGSLAALPWAVARYLARSDEAAAGGKAMRFGLSGALLQAAVFGPVAGVVCWWLGGPLLGVAGALAAALISLLAAPVGFLQGTQRLTSIAVMRSIETAVRLALTVALVVGVAHRAGMALLGFPLGSAVALGYALLASRRGFPLSPVERGLARALTRQAALLGAIQVLLAMLGAMDTVYADASGFSASETASYQSAALIARVPLFFSAALVFACYTPLAAARTESEAGRHLRASLRGYLWLGGAFALLCLTMPSALLDLAIPQGYDQTLPLLRITCVTGVLVGAVNVVTTGHQARGRFAGCIALLGLAVLLQGVGLFVAGHTGDVRTFALVGLTICALALFAVSVDARQWLRLPRPGSPVRGVLVLAAGAALLASSAVLPWLAAAALLVGLSARAAFGADPLRRARGRHRLVSPVHGPAVAGRAPLRGVSSANVDVSGGVS